MGIKGQSILFKSIPNSYTYQHQQPSKPFTRYINIVIHATLNSTDFHSTAIMVALKTVFFTLASVIAVNADWHVSFTFADGGQVTAHGFLNSGCVNFGKTNSDIKTLYFENNINTDTLELYHQQGCKALAYTAGPGSSNVPDQRYFSYRVY